MFPEVLPVTIAHAVPVPVDRRIASTHAVILHATKNSSANSLNKWKSAKIYVSRNW